MVVSEQVYSLKALIFYGKTKVVLQKLWFYGKNMELWKRL